MLAFCDRLQYQDLKQLSSVEIAICTQHTVDPWLDAVTRLPAHLKHVHFRLRPLIENRWTSQDSHLESLQTFGEVVENVVQRAPNAHISISSASGELEPTLRACADMIMLKIRRADGDTHCTPSSNESLDLRSSTVEGLQERRITLDPFNRASIRAETTAANSTEACPRAMSQRVKV